MGLDRILLRGSKLFPNKTAVVDDSGLRYTYGELDQRVNRLCSAFKEIGLSKGDKIAYLSRNTAEYFTVCFASARFGAILVPVNFMLSAEEISYVISDSEPKVFIFDHLYCETIHGLRDRFRTISDYICIGPKQRDAIHYEDLLCYQRGEFKGEEINENSLSHIIYTSGITGKPKGVMLTHDNFLSMINTFAIEVGLRKNDTMLFTVPQFHVGGVAYQLGFLYVGGCTVVAGTPDTKLILDLIEKERPTYVGLIPTVFIRVILHPDLSKYDLSSVRIINFGASSMPFDKFKRASEFFNVDFVHTYGLTESSCWLTFNYISRDDFSKDNSEKILSRCALSCGREGINIEVRVVDKDGNNVKPGSVGEIIARGPNIMKGYWKLEEETRNTLKDGWLFTGDMATVDDEGYIFIVDRKKDMIVSGGENIYPGEVENVISLHPAVQEVAVIGVPDDFWVEAVKAVVVLKEGQQVKEQEIIDHCKRYLASYKKPKSVEFWKQLPRNPIGKLMKNVIREKYWGKRTLQDV